jgi:hypothetical protein
MKTIGLDFGTHQTKVCVENAANPLLKSYRFMEFEGAHGTTIILPSIVQINQDGTLRYGSCDETSARHMPVFNLREVPEFISRPFNPPPPPPKPRLESMPVVVQRPRAVNDLRALGFLLDPHAEERQAQARKDVEERNRILQSNYEAACALHAVDEAAMEVEWQRIEAERRGIVEQERNRILALHNRKAIFRYFKMPALGLANNWDFPVDARVLAVLYLANVLFLVEKEEGKDVFIQMGIPQTLGERQGQQTAKGGIMVLAAARQLVDLIEDYSDFTSSKVEDLEKLIEWPRASIDALQNELGISVLPEAFAGLRAITSRRGILPGFSLLVDIGGGTTDVALFTLNEQKDAPDIAAVVSIQGGLNSILETVRKEKPNLTEGSLQAGLQKTWDLQYMAGAKELNNAISKRISELLRELVQQFNLVNHGLDVDALHRALLGRPIYYCGGGGVFIPLRKERGPFSDVYQISSAHLQIPNLRNGVLNAPMDTIMAIAYGLSVGIASPPRETPIQYLFQHLAGIQYYERRPDRHDYDD